MANPSRSRSRRSQISPAIPAVSRQGLGAFVFHLVVILIGLGLVAAAIAKAVPISLARISLERTAPRQVQGTLSYVFCGIPIFWRSLEGVHHLERQDYTQGDFTGRRHKFLGDMSVSRVGFMDAEGRTLAWSEKGFVFNAQSRIADFLNGDAPTFFLMEDRLAPLLMSDSMTTRRALASFVLITLGMWGAIIGIRGMIRVLFFKPVVVNDPADSSAPESG